MIEKNGYDQISMLLRHLVAEQARRSYSYWEVAQFGLALALGGCLFLATERRISPLVLCTALLVAVILQHFALTPELDVSGPRD